MKHLHQVDDVVPRKIKAEHNRIQYRTQFVKEVTGNCRVAVKEWVRAMKVIIERSVGVHMVLRTR